MLFARLFYALTHCDTGNGYAVERCFEPHFVLQGRMDSLKNRCPFLLALDSLKQRLNNTPENMRIFPNAQTAIVNERVWQRVQELRENKRRPAKQAERQTAVCRE